MPSFTPPKTILAFIPNWLGDVVMCTPALRALKAKYPDATLTVAGKGACCAVLAGLPWVDHLVPLPERPGFLRSFGLRDALRAHSPDVAVIFPHGFRTAWLAWLSGARHRLGVDRGGRWLLLTDALPRFREGGIAVPRYTALEYLEIAARAGAPGDGAGLELAADPGELAEVRGQLEPGRPVVCIAPGAAFGPSKRWLPERFAAVADALHRNLGAQCVLLTGPGEEDTRAEVLDAVEAPLLDCSGGQHSIGRLKATIAACDLLVGNDSGPRHIAIAFQKPVICVMGSTSPAYTESPWERGEVLRVDVDCGPCQKPHCTTDHRCMTGVTVARVIEAATRFLRP